MIQHLSYAKKVVFFPEKKDGRHFAYVLEYMLTLVSFDKMQNISILMRKISKSEGRSLESYSSKIDLSPPVNYFY